MFEQYFVGTTNSTYINIFVGNICPYDFQISHSLHYDKFRRNFLRIICDTSIFLYDPFSFNNESQLRVHDEEISLSTLMADTLYKVHHVTLDNVQSMTINFALLPFCKTQYVCLWRFRVFFSEMLCDKNLRLYFNEGINFYSRCMS